jgi:hypothetical protein
VDPEDWVVVRDPRHPLYRQKFCVAMWPRRRHDRSAEVVVFYRDEIHTCLPMAAVLPRENGPDLATKLSWESIQAFVEEMDVIHEATARPSDLGASVRRRENPDLHRPGTNPQRGDR